MIGYILIGISMAFDPQRPPLEWKSAQWLPFYLIGMGIISWLGQYPLKGTAARRRSTPSSIPFWWDMLIVAAFSLVIYYWAMATGLSREETLDLVAAAERAGRTAGHRAAPLSPATARTRVAPSCGGATRVLRRADCRRRTGPFGPERYGLSRAGRQ